MFNISPTSNRIPQNVKGMTNMSARQLNNFLYESVKHYSTYNKLDKFYSLNILDLPDFIQNEFAALIMLVEPYYAEEATSSDNKYWQSKMLPILTRYLSNSTDKDESIEFNNIWKECVTSHMHSRMQELIDDELASYNNDHGYTFSSEKYYGINSHGSI